MEKGRARFAVDLLVTCERIGGVSWGADVGGFDKAGKQG